MSCQNPNHRKKFRILSHTNPAGFSLIITISLMILLALLAVGLLSLSSVGLRTSKRSAELQEAQTNARLALMLAIGDLQREAGPDQRITATADILSGGGSDSKSSNAHWTGVWKSWTALSNNGVDEVSSHATIATEGSSGMHPTYEESRKDHFVRWLVSGDPSELSEIQASDSGTKHPTPRPGQDDDSVLLVGSGTLGDDAPEEDHVGVNLVTLQKAGTASGRMGWWIGDESTKAPVAPNPYDREEMSHAMLVERSQAPPQSASWLIDGMDHVSESETAEKIFSHASLEMNSGKPELTKAAFHEASPWSRGVLADVREGGLKRDLSAILDRPIRENDQDNEFMLYKFKEGQDERVPIQDLSAYYQLYRDHLKNGSRALRSSEQVTVPNYQSENFRRTYSGLHRMPVPVKVQFLLSRIGRTRSNLEIQRDRINKDPYKLHIGITPAITLWNPYNVPLVMESGAQRALQLRYFNLPLAITWKKNDGQFTSQKTSLSWITNRERSDNGDRYTGFTGWLAGTRPIIFQPGEVRVFSLRSRSTEIVNSNKFQQKLEMVPGWDPDVYIELSRSANDGNTRHVLKEKNNGQGGPLTFKANDNISFTVHAAGSTALADGSALQFFLRQGIPGSAKLAWDDRSYQLISRPNGAASGFNLDLMKLAFPGNSDKIDYKPIPGSQMANGRPAPFLLVSLTAGCEVGAEYGNEADGRRFASRPFLHSSPIHAAPLLDRADKDALYQHGWNWWITDVNSSLEASVQVASDNRTSYYGGGYTALFGSRHVIQQEIPMTPPMSIAALSHARLGGWSLATAKGGAKNSHKTIAIGGGGLYPHTLQAIGNSYAHPYIEPDKANTSWTRVFDKEGNPQSITLADHSYLANKALWDEYFFSSIAPRETAFYGGSGADAKSTASDAFFGDRDLPNRRLMPLRQSIDEKQLDDYFDRGKLNELAERNIARHLLVRGPFNVNSTSVAAWRSVFSALRAKDVVNTNNNGVEGGIKVGKTSSSGTLISQFTVSNGDTANESSTDPADQEQWLGWRNVSDEDIEDLAEAMVRQVKLRGPFLSLSEFVNRRLDSSSRELSLKGALQAALDDDEVELNAGFRSEERQIGNTGRMNPAFPQALEGPVAYGSAAYVDQADVLRGMGSTLTPRGDTFVIRAYGDALSKSGQVVARAWCEAVVQRSTDYIDPEDESWVKQEDLKSQANKQFGRSFEVVSFRWLHAMEV